MTEHPPITRLILTGADGLLGQAIRRVAGKQFPGVQVISIASARRGGFDLCDPEVVNPLLERQPVPEPETCAIIHAAASIEWTGTAVLTRNALMAAHVAQWAKLARLKHCLYVSSVSVYTPAEETVLDSPCQPNTMYGIGKLAGELAWKSQLPPEHACIVRMAGILGWQKQDMFWNKLLHEAASPTPAELQYQARFLRNYITDIEAAECLLRLALGRVAGTHLVAGQDEVSQSVFVAMLESLRQKPLPWQRATDRRDRIVYLPSEAVRPYLQDFEARLTELWQNRPATASLPAS